MRRLLSFACVLAALGAGTTVPSASAACTTGSDCDFSERLAAADAYLATRPGTVGYVLRDRTTGVIYRNAHAGEHVWTASTIKLGMVVGLLTRQRAGTVTLTDSDRALMAAMLHSSDDDAADTLWSRYSGADHQAFNADFPAYGLTGLQPQRGFSRTFPYWVSRRPHPRIWTG